MTCSDPIGGYFELELRPGRRWPHSEAIQLGSGRSCLEYVLRTERPSHVHLPKYTCDVMLEPLERTGTSYSFYSINSDLELASMIEPAEGELLVYTNYFGVKDGYCRALSEALAHRLVLDCSQALFFVPPAASHSFYSPRKFVGAPDGGCLYTRRKLEAKLERDVSVARYSHLVGRIDLGPEAAYADFKANDDSLRGQPLRHMSESTERLLQALDYDWIRERRLSNFRFLHDALGGRNGLRLDGSPGACPMVYPLLASEGLRERLLANKIFVATYWPNVFEWCSKGEWEHELASRLLPLPIDQRYEAPEMQRIVNLIA